MLPSPIHTRPGLVDRLAAADATFPLLRRIPLHAAPFEQVEPMAPSAARFERPAGSYGVRAFGNTVHAFLEQLTREMERGSSPGQLAAEIGDRAPQIVAVLRAAGLPVAECERLSTRVIGALHTTLTDPTGVWVLSPHSRAATEHTLRKAGVTLRPDRTFLAGAEALSSGDTHLWVVDYKTATPGGRNMAVFLEEERGKYAPQMRSYASALVGDRPVRLGLYYPLVPTLIEVV